jgi:glutamate-1-semialdehyde 2,1-aminomutase
MTQTRSAEPSASVAEHTGADVLATYRRRTGRSRAAYDQARALVPSGAPAALGHMAPYPVYVTRGDGPYVWDADENRLLDFFAADWLLVLGHRHPAVIAALTAQLERGLTFGNPDPQLGYEYAALLNSRLPSLQRVRFTASGTEATWAALTLARAFTGRCKIAKVEGGFHGTHDVALIGSMRVAGGSAQPVGLMPGTADNVVTIPYNDPDEAERILLAHAGELAAVIVEPVLGGTGMVPATGLYLERLREITAAQGIVLIFDEVVTFPVTRGGAQGHYGITPDLTTLGKSISGGLPLAAFGGRADIMDLTDPTTNPSLEAQFGSTLGGIPFCLAAGLAQVGQLTPDVHRRLQSLGDHLRAGVREVADRRGVPLQVTGLGHLFSMHWTAEPVTDARTAYAADRVVMATIVLSLINQGVLVSRSGSGIVNASQTDSHIEEFLTALDVALGQVQ